VPFLAAAVLVQTLSGTPVDALAAPAGTVAIVYLFTSTECPISNRYAPEVRRLVDAFAAQGIRFRLVYPDPADSAEAIREHVRAFAYGDRTEAFRDPDHALVKLAHATVTPEAAVFANGRLVYHGRIDDRFVDLGVERPAPTVHDLGDALAAIVAGRPVPHASTQAVGCYIADFKR
jgi:AhpC/TSA family